MASDPWEALEIDDSDFPSLLRRCNRKSQPSPLPCPTSTPKSPPSSSPNLIPGPAGVVQAAMLRKLHNNNTPFSESPKPLSTQEYIKSAIEDPGSIDDDFSLDPWLSALEFIHRQGLTDDDGTIGTPLSWIKTQPKMDNRKVTQVVAIIKSCTPNGLGDLMVTLKDPTATIDASVHRNVLLESKFGKEFSVGTVLILQKVSIFSPSRSVRYLNITLNNVFKAISKDSGPSQQNLSAPKATVTVHGVENSKQPWIKSQPNVSTLSQVGTDGIMNNLKHTGSMRGRVHNCKGIEADEGGFFDEINTTQNPIVEKEHFVGNGIFNRMKRAPVLTEREETVVMDNWGGSIAGRGNHLKTKQSCNEAHLENVNVDKEKRQVTGLLPQWTDEQVAELLEFD